MIKYIWKVTVKELKELNLDQKFEKKARKKKYMFDKVLMKPSFSLNDVSSTLSYILLRCHFLHRFATWEALLTFSLHQPKLPKVLQLWIRWHPKIPSNLNYLVLFSLTYKLSNFILAIFLPAIPTADRLSWNESYQVTSSLAWDKLHWIPHHQ